MFSPSLYRRWGEVDCFFSAHLFSLFFFFFFVLSGLVDLRRHDSHELDSKRRSAIGMRMQFALSPPFRASAVPALYKIPNFPSSPQRKRKRNHTMAPSDRLNQVNKHLNFPAGLLSGQVAIITGAGQGIGAEAARLFANEGAKVVVADIDSSTSIQCTNQLIEVQANTSHRQSQHGRRCHQRRRGRPSPRRGRRRLG